MTTTSVETAAQTEQDTKLTSAEKVDLVNHEKVIGEWVRTYNKVGSALEDIRDRRLYRETHKTFQEYVEMKWGISRGRAYQLIDAAKIAAEFEPKLVEYAAAKLNAVDPKKRKSVYDKAVKAAKADGKSIPSAKHIEAAAPKKAKAAKPNGKEPVKGGSTILTFEKNVRTLAVDAAKSVGWGTVAVTLESLAAEARNNKVTETKAS